MVGHLSAGLDYAKTLLALHPTMIMSMSAMLPTTGAPMARLFPNTARPMREDFHDTCPFCEKEIGMDSLAVHAMAEHMDLNMWINVDFCELGRKAYQIQCSCGFLSTGKNFWEALDAILEHAKISVQEHVVATALGSHLTGGFDRAV